MKTYITVFILLLAGNIYAQPAQPLIEKVLATVDPSHEFSDLKSIKLSGKWISNDTFNIVVYKMLPGSFKSVKYNNNDSISSIVSEQYYFQLRNGTSSISPRTPYDQEIFEDLFQFNIFYAINETYKWARTEVSEEDDDFIWVNYRYKSGLDYKLQIDKSTHQIIKYSCDCILINNKQGYVLLKNYRWFEGVKLPGRVEFWNGTNELIETFLYYEVEINQLSTGDFRVPD